MLPLLTVFGNHLAGAEDGENSMNYYSRHMKRFVKTRNTDKCGYRCTHQRVRSRCAMRRTGAV
jgi:hypothetical protein